jgi:hypothetical protein
MLTQQSPRVAEATCLAVSDSPLNGLSVVHRLMGLAAQSAHRRGISHILIAVHPRHAPFYIRAAGFRTFASTKPYPSVGGLPAVGLQLNISTLHVDSPAVHRRYFGMEFSPIALSSQQVAPPILRRLASLWQSICAEADNPGPVASLIQHDGNGALSAAAIDAARKAVYRLDERYRRRA